MTPQKSSADPMERLAGKYMTFRLAGEDYGLAILKVKELVGLLEVTRVPGAPSFVRGVVNLRGRVIPVVDLRAKFGLEAADASKRPVIIISQVENEGRALTMGVLVDEVLEVREIRTAEIEPPPTFGALGSEVDFILGIGKTEERVVFLLDIDRVLTSAEVHHLNVEAAEAKEDEAA